VVQRLGHCSGSVGGVNPVLNLGHLEGGEGGRAWGGGLLPPATETEETEAALRGLGGSGVGVRVGLLGRRRRLQAPIITQQSITLGRSRP
jgi:hypothetical protein